MYDDNFNEIVRDLKNGNNRAFNQLYSQTHQLVYKCAFSMLKNDNDANDVMQNVYMKVYNKIGNLNDETKFQSWLMSITYNESKSLLLSQKRYTERINSDIDISEKEEWISDDNINECSFENDYITRETNNIIRNLIDDLPSEQKEVLLLYYFEDKDVSSIADILKCPKGTIKSRLNYSRKNLKKSINTYEEKNQIKLHSGLAMLINIEYMNKIFKHDTVVKATMAGFASVCAATCAIGLNGIQQNPDNDIKNIIYTSEYVYTETTSETLETTELTEVSLPNIPSDDIDVNLGFSDTAYTSEPIYETNENSINFTDTENSQSVYDETTGISQSEINNETASTEIITENTTTVIQQPGYNENRIEHKPDNPPPYFDNNEPYDYDEDDIEPPFDDKNQHHDFDDNDIKPDFDDKNELPNNFDVMPR